MSPMIVSTPCPLELPRRTIVFGGRDFRDREWLYRTLDAHHEQRPFALIIQGGQVSLDPTEKDVPWFTRRKWGADWFAAQWARMREVKMIEVPADWKRYGKRAGPVRNQRMIDEFGATEAIGFPGGRGSADMLKRAQAAGLDWISHSRGGAEMKQGVLL